ncbi:hypothetical protein GCM10011608_10400 [Micromonospora sonchi]|uniref:Uncharacterized protein n=1 Tax=Micromonospora sonchi TaxID=1763543 RepID=A0A917TM14_9ACTN|nr:hypothetical protein [Micromonospora sonchi]GGM27518.1 hypothetical protein GCM10011608_10400 [Micromonospora sonchi]
MTGKTDLLAQLAAIPGERAQAAAAFDKREIDLVAELRSINATWEEIGAALGLGGRQSAQRKFKPLIEETRTVRVRPNPKVTP